MLAVKPCTNLRPPTGPSSPWQKQTATASPCSRRATAPASWSGCANSRARCTRSRERPRAAGAPAVRAARRPRAGPTPPAGLRDWTRMLSSSHRTHRARELIAAHSEQVAISGLAHPLRSAMCALEINRDPHDTRSHHDVRDQFDRGRSESGNHRPTASEIEPRENSHYEKGERGPPNPDEEDR